MMRNVRLTSKRPIFQQTSFRYMVKALFNRWTVGQICFLCFLPLFFCCCCCGKSFRNVRNHFDRIDLDDGTFLCDSEDSVHVPTAKSERMRMSENEKRVQCVESSPFLEQYISMDSRVGESLVDRFKIRM